jgi:hypothetical protein
VKYGKKWRGPAVAVLRLLGFEAPQGFDLL